MQHTYLEFPYRDWWIKPIDQETALIHIQGKFNEIEIKVGCGYCTLMSPSNYSLDAVFKDVKMSPSQLLSKLSVFGLNFMGPTTLNGLVVDTDFILKVLVY